MNIYRYIEQFAIIFFLLTIGWIFGSITFYVMGLPIHQITISNADLAEVIFIAIVLLILTLYEHFISISNIESDIRSENE